RGLLDGHVVLSRSIAERGRFPAIDLLRSVSRALPDCASKDENALLATARSRLSLYESSEIMIRSGLYQSGSNSDLDRAVTCFPDLDRFIAMRFPKSVEESFEVLAEILANGEPAGDEVA
ncbi:MAG: flagellum-specific ATP synthase FliI, partial [Boseongicola sp.]